MEIGGIQLASDAQDPLSPPYLTAPAVLRGDTGLGTAILNSGIATWAAACPSCNTPFPDSAKFCYNCGQHRTTSPTRQNTDEDDGRVPQQSETVLASSAATSVELPDLTDRLQACGVYDEYLRYSERYLQWRQGGARGAKGEVTAPRKDSLTAGGALIRWSCTKREVGDFKYWYPTPQKFEFYFTTAYWVAITSLTGSMLLNFASAVSLWDTKHIYDHQHHAWVELAVSVLFLLSVYLPYVQLINLPAPPRRYLWPRSWQEVMENAEVVSASGIITFLLSMLFWIIPAIVMVLPDSAQPAAGGATHFILSKIPTLLGGIGFFVGGICECLHNRHAESYWEPVVSVSILSLIGGTTFALSSIAGLFGSSLFGKINIFIGSICFSLSSVCLIRMWTANDFGCALLSQLNNAVKDGHQVHVGGHDGEGMWVRLRGVLTGEQETPNVPQQTKKLSFRGATFLVIYCWLSCVLFLNSIGSLGFFENTVRHILDFVMNLILMFAVMVILVVHSVLTEAPHVQPYRLALMSTRLVLTIAMLVQTFTFFHSLLELEI